MLNKFLSLSLLLLGAFTHAAYEKPMTVSPPIHNTTDAAFLKEVLEASAIYNREYRDKVHKGEPKRKLTKAINGLVYHVNRFNHGLAHGVRQAYLVERIVQELEQADTDNALVKWIKKQDRQSLIEKLKRLALYYRIGRENEFSPSSGTDDEKARFNENMRVARELFKKVAKKSAAFDNSNDIGVFADALLHYEYKSKEKPLQGDTRFIDQIIYAAHILDLRRVNAPWNRPPEGPAWALPEISEILGFHKEITPIIKRLNAYSEKLLEATGERDAWKGRSAPNNDFFFQAYAPELMILKLNHVRDNYRITEE